jgi:thymidylate synthase (FAD)
MGFSGEPVLPLWTAGGGAVGPLARFVEPQRVLDHGFVQLIDVMGDDAAIEEAARVSYQQGTRTTSDRRALIRYMMRHQHTSPFEAAEIKLRVKLPIFVERQWARTRTASWNEVSARYSELPEEFYVPEAVQVCHQSRISKQGRAEPLDKEDADRFRDGLTNASSDAFLRYQAALEEDVARETARIGLPLGTYTEKVWKIDGHNLLHFLALRLSLHAQWEIRQYAQAIAEIVKMWLPLTWEAFVDYRLEAVTLSRMEVEVVSRIVSAWASESPLSPVVRKTVRLMCSSVGTSDREANEFVKRFLPETNRVEPPSGACPRCHGAGCLDALGNPEGWSPHEKQQTCPVCEGDGAAPEVKL